MLKLVVFALCCVAIFATGTLFANAITELIKTMRKH